MLPDSSRQLFRFCQLDFSFPLGPADGRYLARAGDDDLDVIVFKTLGAPRRGRGGRRARRVEEQTVEPDPVTITRVTVIDSSGFDDETAANSWLERCRKDEGEREQFAADALSVLNRAIHAHRVSAGDPYERELSRDRAQSARLGYGGGDDLVDGRWSAAHTLPPPRVRSGRRQMLSPQEQLAAILSGRSQVHPSEDLALRARLDLDQDRTRQAALQMRAAADALFAELESSGDDSADSRVHEQVSQMRHEARDLSTAALAGELDPDQSESLARLVGEVERLLRRRRHTDA